MDTFLITTVNFICTYFGSSSGVVGWRFSGLGDKVIVTHSNSQRDVDTITVDTIVVYTRTVRKSAIGKIMYTPP